MQQRDSNTWPRASFSRVASWKKVFIACLAAAIAISTASVAAALITGSTGQVIHLSSAPASVKLNALENATSVFAFDERQGVTLGSALTVDAVNPGTYTSFPSGNATIPVGTVVDSHLIHSDIPSKKFTAHRTGSVTYNDDIVGVIASTSRLAASDNTLGAPGTQYAGTTTFRGLESSEDSQFGGDKFTISADHRTLSFDLQTYVMDEIRVVTRHASPLTTTITDAPDPVQAGSNVAYTITVTNTASSTASNVQVQDLFPGATLVSATAPGGCSGTTTVTCGLGSLSSGGSAIATIVVTSPSTVPAGGTIVNTASSPPGQSPAATATTTVVSPVLATTIADVPDPVTAGNDVQYTLTVTNNGIAPVTNAHVTDTLPAGSTFVQATGPGPCAGTGPVDCTLGALAIGASAQAQIVVTSPSTVPAGGTITDTAVASPGSNTQASENTTVEAPTDGVSKGFVLPRGSLTITGDNPATLTLPDSGPGAPVEITQGDGSFCDGPCASPATTISDFDGYNDPTQPIQLVLTFTFPDSPTSLTDAATAFGSTIYKDDSSDPLAGVPVASCTTQGAGVAIPHPCVDAHTISQPSPNSFVVTFTILYTSGDPHFARK